MKNANTTLVTLTYGDRLGYLTTLIERSLACPHVRDVIVVNNASQADLSVLPRRWPGQVRVIDLPGNTGSANGYAEGIAAALEGQGQYIWLMDDDNAPTPGSIEKLHDHLRRWERWLGHDKAAVLGYRPDHQADIAQGVPLRFAIQRPSSYFGFHFAQLPYKLWRRRPFKAEVQGMPMCEVSLPFATYGGLLAHRDLYEAIGLPRRDMVLYADDTEYTRRITARGGQIHLVTHAVLDDLEHSWNIKARTKNIYETFLLGNSEMRAYYTARNQAWFDTHVWAGCSWQYHLNRRFFLFMLRLVARRTGTGKRLELIERAIADGESGRLGINASYPL